MYCYCMNTKFSAGVRKQTIFYESYYAPEFLTFQFALLLFWKPDSKYSSMVRYALYTVLRKITLLCTCEIETKISIWPNLLFTDFSEEKSMILNCFLQRWEKLKIRRKGNMRMLDFKKLISK